MMCAKVFSLVFLILFASVCSLQNNSVDMSVDYFKYRDVRIICMLTCNDHLGYKLAKLAIANEMIVSKVDINAPLGQVDILTDLNKCLNQKLSSVGVLIDSQCPGFEIVMNIASSAMIFDSAHKWLIFEDEIEEHANDTLFFYEDNDTIALNSSKAVDLVQTLNTSVDSDIIVCFKKDSSYYLYEVFNFGKVQGGRLNINFVGTWNDKAGITMSQNLNKYKYYARWDFRKWAMRMIVVVSNPPHDFKPETIIGRVAAPGVARITQVSAMALHVIADIHNFRYSYTIGDRWIGSYKPENTKLVASALYYRYQDISPVIRTSTVNGKVDIVHPALTSIETRYYYRIPTSGPGKIENQFLRPLTTSSWFCSLAVVSLCALTVLLASKLEQRPKPFQYAIFSVIASSCQQFFDDSGQIKRASQARQMAVFVSGLSCVLIYNYYTSSVVSWLLNGPPPSINSLEELLESPLQLIFEDIGYARSWLQSPDYYFNKKNAKLEDAMRQKKVFTKKKDEPLLVAVDKGIEMVKAGGYAYHTEADTANILISRKFNQMELCELGSLQSMEKTTLYAAVQKNSPYKEFFVWSLARLSERGIISCLQRRTSASAVSCGGSSPRALALGGAAPAFLLLAFGYLLATVIMLLERAIYKRFEEPRL